MQSEAITRDPICGMLVDPDAGKPSLRYEEHVYHFCCQGCHDKFEADPESWRVAVDPICGMEVERAKAAYMAKVQGQRFFFCSEHCQTRFEEDPEAYAPQEAPAVPGVLYICPMCPEVESPVPADCPICGMALEPLMPKAEDGPNPELVDFTKRAKIGGPMALLLFALEMGGHMGLPVHALVPMPWNGWLQLVLATGVIAAAWPVMARGWSSIRTRNLNMWTLIALGVTAAYLFSIAGVVAPQIFPQSIRGMHGLPPLYFEAAAVILILVLLGQIMELKARERTGDALRALLSLTPKTALRIAKAGQRGGAEEEVPIDQIKRGDLLRLRPGEAVPVDALVKEGRSEVDESMITGEPLPVLKTLGATLSAGTVNGTGGLVIEATAVGQETRLAQIIGMVVAAQRSRAPIQAIADRVASWFVPIVVAIALLAFVAWFSFGPEPRLSFAIVAAVSVLVIACPCALGLATPMSITVAMGRGARDGVLIRDAAALERLAKVDVLVLDKTGTLTKGAPEVAALLPLKEGVGEAELLALASGLEAGSEHPLARAVVQAAQVQGVGAELVSDFEAHIGLGVTALSAEGARLALGTQALMAAEGVAAEALTRDEIAALGAGGASVVFLARAGELLGAIALRDQIKETTAEAIASLRRSGLRIIMATGDSQEAADAIGAALGITERHARATPASKHALIAHLQSEGARVAMVGDGINDAPALAAADLGISMGHGTDIAREASDLTLISGDLRKIKTAQRLAKATMRNIKENLVFAFIYNGLGVPVAAGLLYPAFGLLLSPMIAAFAMSLSSVSVIANALRLSRKRL